jgi:hypothetical protein
LELAVKKADYKDICDVVNMSDIDIDSLVLNREGIQLPQFAKRWLQILRQFAIYGQQENNPVDDWYW